MQDVPLTSTAKVAVDGVISQPVASPLTRAAIFLVVAINPGPDARTAVRALSADLAGLIRAVEFRNLEAGLTCVMGMGSEGWHLVFGQPRPADLHPLREIRAGSRHAVPALGDVLFPTRANHM